MGGDVKMENPFRKQTSFVKRILLISCFRRVLFLSCQNSSFFDVCGVTACRAAVLIFHLLLPLVLGPPLPLEGVRKDREGVIHQTEAP